MAFSRTYDEDEPQRVNRWLAQNGVCSRREAEGLIADGLVSIDGETVQDVGRKISKGQTLELADRGAARLQDKLCVVMHKPMGYVSAQPEPGQIPAVRLLTQSALIGKSPIIPNPRMSLPALGRLDLDSRGLLILSDDGVLAKAIIGPNSEMDKEYLVEIAGRIDDRKLDLLRYGLQLDGRQLRPAEVFRVNDRKLRFILNEGRNRQIRRMCELVDLRVVDLLRIRVGPIELGSLPEGKWRVMAPWEREAMIKAGAGLG
jgi:23S rRNA pseudouridine2604 synthase